MTKSGLEVAIVAEDPLALAGLVHLLSWDTSLRLVRLSLPLDEVMAGAPLTGPAPDVVVLFDRMPGGRAFQATRRLREHVAVLLVCAFDALPCPVAAIQAGASGLVSTGSGGVDLRRAVRAVAAGGVYIGTGVAGAVRGRITEATTSSTVPAAVPALAPREAETLRWIADGYTHAQAARRMRVSPGTVNTYAKRLRLKLNARNKAQLTRRAVELGYLSRPEHPSRLRPVG
ncbi:response regulator transcription factor [Dactylosporangium sp. NPDC050688]|uniref:response regulator transcription factor n=1 Tax=Dactylosporangium sp. NPDC050688 TaxID=3157217 RepID=UPI0033D6DDCF